MQLGTADVWQPLAEVTTIDLNKPGSYSPKSLARRIWQTLFDVYRSLDGDLDNMGDLLIDLTTIEEYVRFLSDYEFVWYFDRDGFTNIAESHCGSGCSFACVVSYSAATKIISFNLLKNIYGKEEPKDVAHVEDLPPGEYTLRDSSTGKEYKVTISESDGTTLVGIIDTDAVKKVDFS